MRKIYSALLVLSLTACSVTDPDEDIPTWVSIDTCFVSADHFTQGTSSHNLTDQWFFVNDDAEGVFETPAVVPLIAKGETRIRLAAGIKMNGISNTRVRYPFLNFYDTIVDLKALDTVRITPVFKYYNTAEFLYLENFESTNTLEKIEGSDTIAMVAGQPDAFEGNFSAAIYLDDQRSFFQARTQTGNNIVVPSGTQELFLEMNYRSNIAFFVYFGGFSTSSGNVEAQVLRINPKESWNKIYVNLSPLVPSLTGASDYFVIIKAKKYPEDPSAYIFLDNLKLIGSK